MLVLLTLITIYVGGLLAARLVFCMHIDIRAALEMILRMLTRLPC